MRLAKILIAILTIALVYASNSFTKTEHQEQDFAVPAYSDYPLLGTPDIQTQRLATNPFEGQLKPIPDVDQLRYFDVNRDLQLNDFDIKQFRTIIENLQGEKLSGLQLTIRFKREQKNQKESFPLLYDLDRDGMFTPFDVDYFTELVNRLDEGASRGTELVQKLRTEIYPQESET